MDKHRPNLAGLNLGKGCIRYTKPEKINFYAHDEGTLITIRHSKLPAHGMQYQQGWIDAYFAPMKSYFG